MSERKRYGYFDIDKTLKGSGSGLTPEMIDALLTFTHRGVNTQRSLKQAERVFDQPLLNLPYIILAGGEVWSTDGQVMQTFPLNTQEKNGLADFVVANHNDILQARFYPAGKSTIVAFAGTEVEAQKCIKTYSETDALGIITCDPAEFARLLKQHDTAMITIRTHQLGLELPSDLSSELNVDLTTPKDIAITRQHVDKGSSLVWVCDLLDIDPATVITAGDNPVTDVPAFKHTFGISVGKERLPHAKHHVASPEELALYLLQLATASK